MKLSGSSGPRAGKLQTINAAAETVAVALKLDEVAVVISRAMSEFKVLSGRVNGLEQSVHELQVLPDPSEGKAAELQSLEKKLLERQTRFEGALMQVIRPCD